MSYFQFLKHIGHTLRVYERKADSALLLHCEDCNVDLGAEYKPLPSLGRPAPKSEVKGGKSKLPPPKRFTGD